MSYILLISLAAIVILAATSSWRLSLAGYLGILFSTLVFFGSFFLDFINESNISLLFMDVGAFIFFVGIFWLFFTMKYLTDSSLFDLTYQSMSKFKEYVDKKGYRTPYESFTIIGGYVLFIYSMFFFAAYAYMGR